MTSDFQRHQSWRAWLLVKGGNSSKHYDAIHQVHEDAGTPHEPGIAKKSMEMKHINTGRVRYRKTTNRTRV